ncbi:MAG: class I SAM-dependent methyltransferase [Candidatus Paceibacterota bacterium]|jgi:hypothetical protein
MLLTIDENLIDQDTCPVCGGDGIVIDTINTINPSSNKKIDLVECALCKHWWHNKLPNQKLLNDLYQSGSEYVVPATYAKAVVTKPSKNIDDLLFEKIFNQLSSYSNKISSTKKSFNYLELGIGSGHMFDFFSKKANVSYGVEPGKWVLSENQNIISDVKETPTDIKFDLIVASDVLEHLSNPTNMLSTLRGFAGNDGIIYCTFPNKDSLKAQIQKGGWHMVRPFGHLHYFSAQSIKNTFKKSGWKIVKMRKRRIADSSILDLIKKFDTSSKNILYRLVKSLLVGQILLGKDQWSVIALNDKEMSNYF